MKHKAEKLTKTDEPSFDEKYWWLPAAISLASALLALAALICAPIL